MKKKQLKLIQLNFIIKKHFSFLSVKLDASIGKQLSYRGKEKYPFVT